MRGPAFCALALSLAACAESQQAKVAASPWLAPGEGVQQASSGSKFERYFPLVDGMVYNYATLNEVGDQGMLVARVHRVDATHGELRFPRGTKRFEYAPDGVVLHAAGGATYVLKAPLEVGASWRGEHGGTTRVVRLDAEADTPAGRFGGCIVTLEERGGDRPMRIGTTFCPEVGVVQLEAAAGANLERAVLKSYASPLKLGPDGVDRVQVPQGAP
jgi:hypothetical protein